MLKRVDDLAGSMSWRVSLLCLLSACWAPAGCLLGVFGGLCAAAPVPVTQHSLLHSPCRTAMLEFLLTQHVFLLLQGVAIVMWACAVTRQRPSRELAGRLLARYIPLFRKRLVSGC